MAIDDLFPRSGEWLRGSGPESDIVISSRIRLARNLDEYPFQSCLVGEKRTELERALRKGIEESGLPDEPNYLNLAELDPVDCMLLVERHLVSKEHAEIEGDRGVAYSSSENVSIMTLEEDHLRLQVMRSGLQLDESWETIDALDSRLESKFAYAFSSDFGYLTACPTNVGTGMRVSVMLHLPALVMTKHIEKVFNAVSRVNMAVRGLYGEGTHASGDFYQISNQVTLGRSEDETLKEFREIIPKIIDYERKMRSRFLDDFRQRLEDRIFRAVGNLESARTISSEETMERLSMVRMGVNLGIIDDLEIGAVNELFILSQPAHLQKLEGQVLDPGERDIVRAGFIRNYLKSAHRSED